MSHRSKQILSSTLRTLLGRRKMARIGRYLYRQACLAHCEYTQALGDQLVRQCVARFAQSRSQPFVVIDVGANVGDWSHSFTKALSDASVVHRIHAIEPYPQTYETLTKNIQTWKQEGTILPFQGGLSSSHGEHVFFSLGANAGQNSMHPIPGVSEPVEQTRISCYTLDELCARWDEQVIGFLKIDTEGHDLEVLRGAHEALTSNRIAMLQFEYNHRWIGSRRYLRDAFEMLAPFGYRIGKITHLGIEYYESWHPELETFIEGNFLAVKHELTDQFPAIKWWNSNVTH